MRGASEVGTYRRIGWERGAWHDVAWTQRPIATTRTRPANPTE